MANNGMKRLAMAKGVKGYETAMTTGPKNVNKLKGK
jgi:hypothetical protein